MNNNVQAIILAAGKSTRFNTEKTKLAETICGQAMILFPIKLLHKLNIPTTVVVGYQETTIKKIITDQHTDPLNFVVQQEPKGTGHALACTQSLWEKDHILVMNGDVPFITPETITTLYNQHIQYNAVLSFVISSTNILEKSYGRVIKTNTQIKIVEAKDFTEEITPPYDINAGIYLINKNFLNQYIATLNDNNANKEFYITDLVTIANQNNFTITTLKAPFDTIRGINTFQELLEAEQIKRYGLINYWMNHGVRFLFSHNVHLDHNVTIGQGSFIGNSVHIKGNTIIGKNCIIQDFSYLENVIIEDNVTIYSHCVIKNSYIQSEAKIGPFAYLRANVNIGQNSEIGNFVEVKNSIIDQHTKAKHLSYIGDSTIGSHVNIGAGTITCNYDGVHKHKTLIKDHAFIGSNNTLVAPITIGEHAFTAAGSTLTTDVPENALAIARATLRSKYDYATKLRPHENTQETKSTKKNTDEFSFVGARIIYPNTPEDEQ